MRIVRLVFLATKITAEKFEHLEDLTQNPNSSFSRFSNKKFANKMP